MSEKPREGLASYHSFSLYCVLGKGVLPWSLCYIWERQASREKQGAPRSYRPEFQILSRISPWLPLLMQRPPVLVFSFLGQKTRPKQFRGRRVSLGSRWERIVHHGGEGVAAGMGGSQPHYIHSQEVERNEHWCSAHSLHFRQSRTPGHGMVLPTFIVSLPASVNPI